MIEILFYFLVMFISIYGVDACKMFIVYCKNIYKLNCEKVDINKYKDL